MVGVRRKLPATAQCDRLAQGQLHQTFACREPCGNCTHGDVNPSSSLPLVDGDEPTSIPETASTCCCAGANCSSRGSMQPARRSKSGLRARVSSIRVQTLLWPTPRAGYQSASTRRAATTPDLTYPRAQEKWAREGRERPLQDDTGARPALSTTREPVLIETCR